MNPTFKKLPHFARRGLYQKKKVFRRELKRKTADRETSGNLFPTTAEKKMWEEAGNHRSEGAHAGDGNNTEKR